MYLNLTKIQMKTKQCGLAIPIKEIICNCNVAYTRYFVSPYILNGKPKKIKCDVTQVENQSRLLR